jgi:hypothetical protein
MHVNLLLKKKKSSCGDAPAWRIARAEEIGGGSSCRPPRPAGASSQGAHSETSHGLSRCLEYSRRRLQYSRPAGGSREVNCTREKIELRELRIRLRRASQRQSSREQ